MLDRDGPAHEGPPMRLGSCTGRGSSTQLPSSPRRPLAWSSWRPLQPERPTLRATRPARSRKRLVLSSIDPGFADMLRSTNGIARALAEVRNDDRIKGPGGRRRHGWSRLCC